jgi:hypothetical protein
MTNQISKLIAHVVSAIDVGVPDGGKNEISDQRGSFGLLDRQNFNEQKDCGKFIDRDLSEFESFRENIELGECDRESGNGGLGGDWEGFGGVCGGSNSGEHGKPLQEITEERFSQVSGSNRESERVGKRGGHYQFFGENGRLDLQAARGFGSEVHRVHSEEVQYLNKEYVSSGAMHYSRRSFRYTEEDYDVKY